jgi:hypothetical protein
MLISKMWCSIVEQKHKSGGIPRWSPTLVLVARFIAYVWQSGQDAQFSLTCGGVCSSVSLHFSIAFYREGAELHILQYRIGTQDRP